MTDTKKAAPNGTAQSKHSTNYNTPRFPSLALADRSFAFPAEYQVGGVHRALFECVCTTVEEYKDLRGWPICRDDAQRKTQAKSGYTLSKIRIAINLLIASGALTQEFDGHSIKLDLREVF